MAYYCPERIYKPLKAATELLAGIPSVVYGFFGLVVIGTVESESLEDTDYGICHGNGSSILTASILTWNDDPCQRLSDLQSLRLEQCRHSIMKGQWHLEQHTNAAIFRVVIPAAKSGVIAGIGSWNRPCDRRDDGSYHGCRKPGKNAGRHFQRCTYTDSQYRN